MSAVALRSRIRPFRLLCIVCVGLLATVASAQRSGKLRLMIDPGTDLAYVVDGKYRMQDKEVELLEGPHRFTFWAPDRRAVDTVLTVVAGTVTEFRMRLPYSQDFMLHQQELKTWRSKRLVERGVPLVATAGALVWTGIQFGAYNKAADRLESYPAQYADAISGDVLQRMKDVDIPADKKAFTKARTGLYIAGGTALVAAGWTYLRYRNGTPPPQLQDRERIRFEGLVWTPTPDGGIFMGGLTLNLVR